MIEWVGMGLGWLGQTFELVEVSSVGVELGVQCACGGVVCGVGWCSVVLNGVVWCWDGHIAGGCG